MTDSSKDQSMSGMNHDMSSMKGMDHDMSSMTDSSKDQSMSGMNHDMSSMKGMDHDMSSMTDSSKDQSMSGMNHGMQMTTSNAPTQEKNGDVVYGWANASTPVGQKALQYSDLQSLKPQPDTRAPEREMKSVLVGTWSAIFGQLMVRSLMKQNHSK